jgi:hypothetical protein
LDNQWSNTPPHEEKKREQEGSNAAGYSSTGGYQGFSPVYEHNLPPKLKHSGLGIASFVLFVAMAVLFVVLVISLVVQTADLVGLEGETLAPEELAARFEDAPELLVLSFLMFGTVIGNIIGLILGIIGIVQKERKKVFAILGTILNGLVVAMLLFFVVIIIAIGSTM